MAQVTQHIIQHETDKEPKIAGTGLKVRIIGNSFVHKIANAEEIAEYHNLTLAQVYAAIACYYDNFEEFEAIENQAIEFNEYVIDAAKHMEEIKERMHNMEKNAE